jgi:hypothetical protein
MCPLKRLSAPNTGALVVPNGLETGLDMGPGAGDTSEAG